MKIIEPVKGDADLNDIFYKVLMNDLNDSEIAEKRKLLAVKIIEGYSALESLTLNLMQRFKVDRKQTSHGYLELPIRNAYNFLYQTVFFRPKTLTDILNSTRRQNTLSKAGYRTKFKNVAEYVQRFHQRIEDNSRKRQLDGIAIHDPSRYYEFAQLLDINLGRPMLYRSSRLDKGLNDEMNNSIDGFYLFFQRVKRTERLKLKLFKLFIQETSRLSEAPLRNELKIKNVILKLNSTGTQVPNDIHRFISEFYGSSYLEPEYYDKSKLEANDLFGIKCVGYLEPDEKTFFSFLNNLSTGNPERQDLGKKHGKEINLMRYLVNFNGSVINVQLTNLIDLILDEFATKYHHYKHEQEEFSQVVDYSKRNEEYQHAWQRLDTFLDFNIFALDSKNNQK